MRFPRHEVPTPEEASVELAAAQRAYGAAAVGAFKGFGLALVGAVGVLVSLRSPDTMFRPDAWLVRELGRSGAATAAAVILGVFVLIGLVWMARRIGQARNLLAHIRVLRPLARVSP